MSPHKQGTLRPDVSDKDHILGPKNAPVTLTEYGDFECPHCFRAAPIVEAVLEQLGDKVRFVFRNFPLTEIHPRAFHAAVAAESVAANVGEEAYWRMHHSIFEHQQDSPNALDDAHLVRYAAACGADPVQVKMDMENDAFAERVQSDFMSGVRSGVNGTPTFFVNGARFDGDWSDVRSFAAALDAAAHATIP
jgi:protein-disulfide isomerase